jgi:hypothetical protein
MPRWRRAVVATRDSGHGPDAGVSGRGADCVAAAQADADHADPGRVYLDPVREHADRGSQVGQFSLAVLMLAAAAAFPQAPMVKGERGETGRGEQFGVGADDLLFDPGEGTSEHHSRLAVICFRKAEVAYQLHAFAAEGDPDLKLCHDRQARRRDPGRPEGTLRCPFRQELPWRWSGRTR